MHHFKAKHVPALDGLRGLAILLVITHHQLIPLFLKGGFLGVDLFFVLSGFLITTLLWTEFDATKTISLKNFYARRALRLGPALLLYLIVCLLVVYHSNIGELTHEIKLVGIAVAYSTNWRMAFILKRAARSVVRAPPETSIANSRSTLSPAGWPKESL